jgi:AraC-like DNA-binding protein
MKKVVKLSLAHRDNTGHDTKLGDIHGVTLPANFHEVQGSGQADAIDPAAGASRFVPFRSDFVLICNQLPEGCEGLSSQYNGAGWMGLRVRLSGDIREFFGVDEKIFTKRNIGFLNYGEEEDYAFERVSTASVASVNLLFRRSFLLEKLGDADRPLLNKLENLGQPTQGCDSQHWLDIPHDDAVYNLARQILDADDEQSLYFPWVESRSLDLLVMALSALKGAACAAETPKLVKPAELRQVQKVQQLLKKSLIAPPSVAALCREVGVSRRRLYQIFKAATGQTMTEFLQQERMRYAAELLSRGAPVALVAEQVGYLDQSSFTKVFKRHYGVLPRNYDAV